MTPLRQSDKLLVRHSLYSLAVIFVLAAVAYSLSRPASPLVLGIKSMYNP